MLQVPSFQLPYLPIRSDIFSSKPYQIYALRRVLKWSKADLGAVVGLHASMRSAHQSVSEWERGVRRPHPVFQRRMLQLVDHAKADYMEYLNRIPADQHLKIIVLPVVRKRGRRKPRSGILRITSEVRKLLNEGTVYVAPLDQTTWFLAEADGTSESAAGTNSKQP